MAGTMGNFYVGVTGMQTHQYAMNTTAHNITNAGTDGYSRQQVLLSDLGYTKLANTPIGINQAGLGARIEDVRLVRDRFMDKAYRKELGREQYYQTKYDVVAEVQNYFGELESSAFRKSMQNLWSSAEEMQKEPNSIVTRSSFIASGVNMIEQANEIYSELTTFQKKLDTQITDQVDRINELAEEIYDLNYKITMVEASGIESANDYRDLRDAALDELGGLISISYKETTTGQVDVYAEHRTLVSMDRIYKMSTKEASDSCDYLVPVWEDDMDNVFNMHFNPENDPRIKENVRIAEVPNAESETDTGSLKALVMSRGDWIANYTDIPIAPEPPKLPAKADFASEADYNLAMAQYNTDYKNYQDSYKEFSKERIFYNAYVEPYTVNNILAQFDQLVHGLVTTINDILCPNKELTIMDPANPGQAKTITVLDTDKAGFGMGRDNKEQGVELFNRKNMERYTEQEVTLLDGTTQKVKVYNEEDPEEYLTLYTLGNVEVNDELIKNPSLLGLSNEQNEELQNVANQLIQMWNDDFATLGPNSLVTSDFMGYYKEFIADFANKGYTYNGLAESQQQTVQEIDNQRQSVVGVSTDEELSNLIKFQQGFNASSRYFTVVSEMVQHLIDKLG